MDKKKESKKGRSKIRLGDLLIKYKLISTEQLEAALHKQETSGGKLGRNLVNLNYITEDVFIKFLASQLNIPSVNLNRMKISPGVQQMIPLETMKKFGVLPVKKEGNTLLVGMTDPTDLSTIGELEFSLAQKINPLALAESQWEFAMRFFDEKGWGKVVLVKKSSSRDFQTADYDLKVLMEELLAKGGSDIHLSVGVQPTIRVNNQLIRLNAPSLTPESMDRFLKSLLTPERREKLKRHPEIDFALSLDGVARFRVNIYKQRNNFAAALRYVVEKIPSFEELAIPSWLHKFAARNQGLILITGPSGHGKSTTMASLIDVINTTRRVNIITLEDPIEYLHKHKMSNVNQREIGTDTESFLDGIKYIFRQDPDVICIGEMRDLESISTALTAAETGHLVLATLHTLSALATVHRIIDVFPSHQQNQVRHQLADALLLILSQRLVPRADGKGRILAYEKLTNSYRVAIEEGSNIIRIGTLLF